MKYTDNCTLEQFMYANYGFNYTKEQFSTGFTKWVQLRGKQLERERELKK